MTLPLANLPATQATVLLFSGLAAVLGLASTVGACLKWRVARRAPHPVIDNLNARIKAWWLMIALIGLAFVLGRPGMLGLFALVSALALREFLQARRGDPARAADRLLEGACFLVFLPLQYLAVGLGWSQLAAALVPVGAFVLLPALAALSGDPRGFLDRVAGVQWGLMACVWCVSHVPALLTLAVPGFEGRQMLLVAFVVLVVQASDVLQYIWGKLLGRRPVAPSLSPSKTLEGLLGGVLSASLLGGALWWITPFAPWQAAGLAWVACCMGFLGGLVMSAIKRDRGLKDWGRLIEGHGGMLDRVDSLCFAAPVFFHLVRWGWT